MLNGFANENMSQNRFMARTRELNSNFSNAIGARKEVTPLPDRFSKSRPVPTTYANAYGNPVQRATRPLVYNPYANAIGKTTYVKPSPTDPAKTLPRCSSDGSSYICMGCPAHGGVNCPTEEGGYRAESQAGYEFLKGCGCTYGGINNPYEPNNPKFVQNVSVKFDG
jgi:hypothetical protein